MKKLLLFFCIVSTSATSWSQIKRQIPSVPQRKTEVLKPKQQKQKKETKPSQPVYEMKTLPVQVQTQMIKTEPKKKHRIKITATDIICTATSRFNKVAQYEDLGIAVSFYTNDKYREPIKVYTPPSFSCDGIGFKDDFLCLPITANWLLLKACEKEKA